MRSPALQPSALPLFWGSGVVWGTRVLGMPAPSRGLGARGPRATGKPSCLRETQTFSS